LSRGITIPVGRRDRIVPDRFGLADQVLEPSVLGSGEHELRLSRCPERVVLGKYRREGGGAFVVDVTRDDAHRQWVLREPNLEGSASVVRCSLDNRRREWRIRSRRVSTF